MATGLRSSARTLWHPHYNQLTWDCFLHLSKGFQYTTEKMCNFLESLSDLKSLKNLHIRTIWPGSKGKDAGGSVVGPICLDAFGGPK